MPEQTPDHEIADFMKRWAASGGSEQANAQLFLSQLCRMLDLPEPDEARPVNEENTYSFERKVYIPSGDGSRRPQRLDLYRRGCFVLEAKQGQDKTTAIPLALPMAGATRSTAVRRGTRAWEDTMLRARRQAEAYVRALPANEGRPPFVIVADIGHCFDIYAEFSRTGGMYIPFPTARESRIYLRDLEKPEVRELLRTIWLDPLSLDPSRRSARVTEAIARLLAELARSLEDAGNDAELVAAFLMRCLFSMFAEDVGLLPANAFQHLLEQSAADPQLFRPLVEDLWRAMNEGTVSVALQQKLRRFNGNIFASPRVLELSGRQIAILREAARADWREVEPAIFGTLLERALNPKERHKLGAHYTPRAYVERLVLPTVITPLREEWQNVQAAASLLATQGKDADAQRTITDFHRRLCAIRVLDPACGSGNFLYVTMEHMKRLEGEILSEAATYGEFQRPLEARSLTVDPHQFLGLEINPRAAHIAEMVLWIGHLQWHYRTHGNVAPAEPIVRAFHNIECRDAVLAYDGWHYTTDAQGKPVTHWNGTTYRMDLATGRRVPDENARVADKTYTKPRVALWPDADFIVGNPPFIGGGTKRSALGSGYFEALSKCYGELPEACDFVMYWWHKAAELIRHKKATRFGFITTNSLSQIFNRRIIALHIFAENGLHIQFAIPDHPWVDTTDGAAVRIAMSVGAPGRASGALCKVIGETPSDGPEVHVALSEAFGLINADLTIGADVSGATPLSANENLSCPGVKLHGSGFIVTAQEASALGLGRISGLDAHIRPYRHGRDITDKPRGVFVIDLFGLSEKQTMEKFPEVFQLLDERVKPERVANASRSKDAASYAEQWWLFGKPRGTFRPALEDLPRFIVTPETAKHRFFVFLDGRILPDNMLINVASADAYHLGILSSQVHVTWALAAGGTLEDRPRYNKTRCFETFPFPDPTPELKARIRSLGEQLDAHRKSRQALYPELTMTGMYNVLEALRAGRELTAKERTIHEQGLVTLLRQFHNELDAAVADAYGWPHDLPEEDILSRLVALNAERATEEAQGRIRWLRPEYQCRIRPEPSAQRQGRLDMGEPAPGRKRKTATQKAAPPQPWPTTLPQQVQAVRDALATLGGCADATAIAKRFRRAQRARIEEVLATLTALGYVAVEGECVRQV